MTAVGYIGGGEKVKPKKKLLIERIALVANLVGVVIGAVEMTLGSYVGGAVTVMCTVVAIVCIRNIRRIKKEVTG
jgi:F0F1-type ATP synthase assembly protein I